MMGYKQKLGPNEHDATTAWRRMYNWGKGHLRWTKTRMRRCSRREGKRESRDARRTRYPWHRINEDPRP